jgi:Holliday junction resolvase
MSAMQRNKGAAGERELFGLLSHELGFVVRRGLGAARDGGADSLDVPGWAIECKRCEAWSNAFWDQATAQARASGRKPALFWRQSRKPWAVTVDVADLSGVAPAGRYVATISLECWCALVREQLRSDAAGPVQSVATL